MMPSLDDMRRAHSPDFVGFLKRAAKRIQPATIIDVGASNGCWSLIARDVWPEANLLCIEANPLFEQDLRATLAQLGGNASAVLALAGAVPGACRLHYHEQHPYQDVMAAPPDGGGREMPVVTLDGAVASAGYPGPYLVKLDVHGREHHIAEGARAILQQTVGIVAEVYTWPVGEESLPMLELLPIFLGLGFALTDFCSPIYRPIDGRLSSVDALLEPVSADHMGPGWA